MNYQAVVRSISNKATFGALFGLQSARFNYSIGSLMSEENFKDSSSKRHLFIAILAMFGAPLLPMLAGWFTVLAN